MGEQHITPPLDGTRLRSFVTAVLEDIRALEWMLANDRIETGSSRVGAEQELFLVDEAWRPAPAAIELLSALDDAHFTTEMAAFNLEINLDPLPFSAGCLSAMERQILELVGRIRDAARPLGVRPMLTGILPTIRRADLERANMTPVPRYRALDEALGRLRGEPYEFRIAGTDELIFKHDSVVVEGANASFQVHLQVDPGRFARTYNLAQAITAPVLAAAVNSPLLFGRRLWRETRIALFQQSVDTRGSRDCLRERGPRVTFGSRWVDESVTELYREDLARFRALLGCDEVPDPFGQLARGDAPELKALRVHNGTVYRWNRACYGVTDGRPHLRIENRVLPAGPTAVDEVGNAAFWLGLMEGMPEVCPDVRARLAFDDAKQNFVAAARLGLDAQLVWLDGRHVPAQALILEELLPMARDGLRRRGVDGPDIDRYLGAVAERVARGRTGASWAVASFDGLGAAAKPAERLNAVTAAMAARQDDNLPVAFWPPAALADAGGWRSAYATVGDVMTTDLITVREDEPSALVASIMDWRHVRHVPVEDAENRLVGIVSYRSLLRLVPGASERADRSRSVADVMRRNPLAVTPETPTLEAIELMRSHRVGALPVVKDGRLVGIVSERDFMEVTARLLEAELRGGCAGQ